MPIGASMYRGYRGARLLAIRNEVAQAESHDADRGTGVDDAIQGARDGNRTAGAVKTIVVGYDGTRSAERALLRVSELAKAFGSKVVVASVTPVEPHAMLGAGAFGLMPYLADGAQEAGTAPASREALWQEHRERVQ